MVDPQMGPPRISPVRRITNLFVWRRLHAHRYFGLVLLAYAIYTLVWSILTVSRFESHHALVYDLGLAMEQMWLPVHAHYSVETALFVFMNEGLPFVLAPFGLIGNYPAILVLQTLAIGGLALPIYGIAARLLKDQASAMILALSSLVFFVSSGANWYDFHFESFFPVTFLAAYYLLLVGQRKASFVAFVAINFIRFPFGVFPFLYGALVFIEATVLGRDVDGLQRDLARKYGISLALTCAALLLVTLYLALPADLGSGQFTALLQFSQTTSTPGPVTGEYDKLLTLALPLAVMLFLPLLSRRWAVFLIPYAFLLIATGFWAYSYPYAFSFQYVFSLVPFLYLGLIDALAAGQRTSSRRENESIAPRRIQRYRRFRVATNARSLVLVVLACMIVGALFFEPYGPLNGETAFPYEAQDNLTVNGTLLTEFHHLAQLIPPSDPNVLIQDNMPELFPRPLAGNEPLVPGVSLFANFTNTDAVNGSFPVWQFGHVVYIRFDYAIADQRSPTYSYGYPSMQEFVTAMYDSGAYGILGEAGGMIVLKHNYTGSIQYYVPYSSDYSARSLYRWPTYAPVSTPTLTSTNTSGNTPLWNGPFVSLMPGRYRVSFALETTNTSRQNVALAQVLGGSKAVLLAQETLTGSDFKANDTWQHYAMDFYAPGPENFVQFILRSLTWNGSLSVSKISVRQLAVPFVTFRVGDSPRDTAFYTLLATIPKGSTVLLEPAYSQGVLNLTIQTAFNDTAVPQFILVNPFEPGYTCTVTCGTAHSIEDAVNNVLGNGTFGLAGELDGVLLLQREYSGPPKWFSPFQETVYPGELVHPYPSDQPFANVTLLFSDFNGTFPALWNGPFTTLPPGSYRVSFTVEASSVASSNQGTMQVLVGPNGQEILNQSGFVGPTLGEPGTWTNISMDFFAPLSYDSAQFIVRVSSWSGTFSLSSILLQQIGA